eukprot:scaffold1838_cov381-Prasinococcus_capsulatus_cf.AAC.8
MAACAHGVGSGRWVWVGAEGGTPGKRIIPCHHSRQATWPTSSRSWGLRLRPASARGRCGAGAAAP